MNLELTEREVELINSALYMLESACYGDLDNDIICDLEGTPDPEEVRTLMERLDG
jgi:hypothetical protein